MFIPNKIFIVIMSAFMSLIFFISLDIIFPSLPPMAKAYQVANASIQISISIYLFGYAVSQLIYGALSDIYGRKPILLMGTSIYLVGTLICLFSTHINILFSGRLIQGLGIGAAGLLSRVILRDCFDKETLAKTMSYVSATIIFGLALAPVLGGVIQSYIGYQGNFFCMFIFGLLLLLVAFKYLPETNKHKNNSSSFKAIILNYCVSIKTKGFICYAMLTAIGMAIILTYSTFNPFLIQNDLGFTPALYGVIALVVAASEFIGATLNSRWVEKLGNERMIIMGFFLVALAALILIAMNYKDETLIGILLAAMLAAIATGFIIPNSIAAAYSTFQTNIGIAGAVFGFLQIIMTATCTFLISSFSSITPIFLSGIYIILAVFGYLIIVMITPDRCRTQQSTQS